MVAYYSFYAPLSEVAVLRLINSFCNFWIALGGGAPRLCFLFPLLSAWLMSIFDFLAPVLT